MGILKNSISARNAQVQANPTSFTPFYTRQFRVVDEVTAYTYESTGVVAEKRRSGRTDLVVSRRVSGAKSLQLFCEPGVRVIAAHEDTSRNLHTVLGVKPEIDGHDELEFYALFNFVQAAKSHDNYMHFEVCDSLPKTLNAHTLMSLNAQVERDEPGKSVICTSRGPDVLRANPQYAKRMK